MARRRSARVHERILDAATKLFAEQGIDATSVDAIAAAAGVSKATVYGHWDDKMALCLEVVSHWYRKKPDPKVPDTGDVWADLETLLAQAPAPGAVKIQRRLTPHLVAYALRHPAFGRAWRAHAIQPAQNAVKQVLRRGIERGQVAAGLDEDIALAVLLGPMMYHTGFESTVDRKALAAVVVGAVANVPARGAARGIGSRRPKRS